MFVENEGVEDGDGVVDAHEERKLQDEESVYASPPSENKASR